jgi:tape measure domain-containing protein
MAALRDLALRLLLNAEDRTGPATRTARQGIESISSQLDRLQTIAQTVLGATLFSSWAQEAIRLADTYKSLQGRLRQVADTQAEFVTSQKEVFQISQSARAELQGTVPVYANIESAVDRLNGTQQHATAITDTLLKSIALLSQGAESDANGLEQFNQAINNGALRGEEFNSVLDSTPGIIQTIAAGLGVTQDEMRGLAEAGELTTVKIFNAFIDQREAVDKAFASLPLTVGQSITSLNN